VLHRPLPGEPLPLDLVNTAWIESGAAVDLLDDRAAITAWLQEHGLRGRPAVVEQPLRQARDALREVLERPGRASDRRVNDVLAHGTVRWALVDGRPVETVQVDVGWRPAWHATRALLDLPADRVRRCAHPDCVLWFLDGSRNGTRRWCSMDTCGSRVKSARHYRRRTAGEAIASPVPV
jgi:predicted RNA-binding Zn ribbon-like protein